MADRHLTATEAARDLGVSDKTIRAWLKAGRFPGARIVRLKGLRQWSIPEADIKRVRLEEAEITGDTGTIAELRAAIEAQGARITVLEQEIAALKTGGNAGASASIGTIRRQTSGKLPELHKTIAPAPASGGGSLPSGYVSAQEFRHNIPNTTAYRWFREHGTTGDWRDDRGHVVTLALSPEIQRDYYLYFSGRPGFVKCVDCPHDGQCAAKIEPEVN